MSRKVNWNDALKTVGGAPDLLAELIEIFLEEHPKLTDGIRTSLAANKLTDLRRFAHTLKGSLRYFGNTDAGKLSLELEVMARDGKTELANELFDRIQVEMESLLPELKAFVASQPPTSEA